MLLACFRMCAVWVACLVLLLWVAPLVYSCFGHCRKKTLADTPGLAPDPSRPAPAFGQIMKVIRLPTGDQASLSGLSLHGHVLSPLTWNPFPWMILIVGRPAEDRVLFRWASSSLGLCTLCWAVSMRVKDSVSWERNTQQQLVIWWWQTLSREDPWVPWGEPGWLWRQVMDNFYLFARLLVCLRYSWFTTLCQFQV